jgi:tyrosine-protein phosphatase
MRAAALSGASTFPEIRALKGGGMHAAYAYVKEKSKWVGPNMS